MTYDALLLLDPEDFPDSEEPVWILGRQYSTQTDKDEILDDVRSRLWFTYRRNFPAIGGTGPSSDVGWGCMLRCGQMILAQALLCLHLGREWRWEQDGELSRRYRNIIRAFLDKKDAYYSIHQIAQMGVGEGKQVGEWYGPNTVAQVLRKLALFDDWSSLAVHVAMDNTVVVDDIESLCRRPHTPTASDARPDSQQQHGKESTQCADGSWRPLLLLIPLRLGLTEINPVYIPSLQVCFTFPQSLGFIGGKPNSAHYFIGYVGDELLYLDPHTCHNAVEVDASSRVPDASYHCQRASHVHITQLDPSIALGFFCKTESDFRDWSDLVTKQVLAGATLPMFELIPSRPVHWPPFVPPSKPDILQPAAGFTQVERPDEVRFYDSDDDDFEILHA